MRLARLRLPALAVLFSLLLFVLLEVALRVLGIGAPEQVAWTLNPQAAYLAPVPEQPGTFTTQYREGRYARVVPPKGEATRLCIFGGSNAASFHERDLLEALSSIAGEGRYEVVNLGNASYGSERTLIIASQALNLLEPDIAVFYTGDIEFAEPGPASFDGPSGGPEWVRSLPGFLAETNLCGLLTRLSSEPPGQPGEEPEPLRRDPQRYSMTYDLTLAGYGRLRANLRAMCRRALARGTRVVLCTPIYNHFTTPFGSSYHADLGEGEVERCEQLLREARGLMPPFLNQLLLTDGHVRIGLNDWWDGEEERTGPIPGRRPCYGPLAELELGEDPSYFTPRLWELHESLETLHTRNFDDAVRADLEQAEGLLGELLERAPDHPLALHQLALVEYLLERDEARVVEHFELAAEYDRCPSRGNRIISRIVREVAAELPGVELLDSAEIFSGYMPMGLVGFEWMRDHAHLHRPARRHLMGLLAETVAGP